jgi:ABC-type polysaccharide/polyol phosphate export permease
MFPDALRRVSELLPLTYVVELVQNLWIAGEWDTRALVVLVCVMVASVLVSARTFRWE